MIVIVDDVIVGARNAIKDGKRELCKETKTYLQCKQITTN